MKIKIAYISLSFFVFIGLFANFLANDKPIICKTDYGYEFPVLKSNYTSEPGCKIILNPLIRYSSTGIDVKNSGYISPFANQNLSEGQQKHYLGTDQLGRDVLAGLIHGTAIALKIGSVSMFLALLLGLLMSIYPSYYGDNGFRKSRATAIIYVFFAIIIVYYLSYNKLINDVLFSSFGTTILILLFLIVLIFMVHYVLTKFTFFKKQISIPLDSIFSLIIKLFQSLPGNFIILVLISLFAKPSIYNIIIVIAILKWPIIARYIRSEMLKIKEESYIEASKALGISDNAIIWKHAFPNVLTPIIVALSFGFGGTILLESTLSFLGIGIPVDHVSWGSLLSDARHNFAAWWLAIFPGIAIFIAIFTFNTLGNIFKK